MRGKDYARQRMARLQKGPQVGLRQTLAALSNVDNRKSKASKKPRPALAPGTTTAMPLLPIMASESVVAAANNELSDSESESNGATMAESKPGDDCRTNMFVDSSDDDDDSVLDKALEMIQQHKRKKIAVAALEVDVAVIQKSGIQTAIAKMKKLTEKLAAKDSKIDSDDSDDSDSDGTR